MAKKSVVQGDLFAPAKRLSKWRADESQEQAAVIAWFDWTQRDLRGRLLHIPNGGYRHKQVAQFLKGQGVRAGVPDLLLPVPRGRWGGLWLEMKRWGNEVTPEQADWLQFLARQNYCVAVVWGQEAAKALISLYLEHPSRS